MKYPKNLFITYCLYESQWWAAEADNEGDVPDLMKCRPEDRAEVLQYSFAALHFPSLSTENVSHIIIDENPGLVRVNNYHAEDYSQMLPWHAIINLCIGSMYIAQCIITNR